MVRARVSARSSLRFLPSGHRHQAFMNDPSCRPTSAPVFLAACGSAATLHGGQSMTEPDVIVLSEGWKARVEYRDAVVRKPYSQADMQISERTYARAAAMR